MYAQFTAFILAFLVTFPESRFCSVKNGQRKRYVNKRYELFLRLQHGFHRRNLRPWFKSFVKYWRQISLQIELLFDFNKYIYYEKNNPFKSTPVPYHIVYIPVSLQYNYFDSDKISLYFSAGIMIGGNEPINGNNIPREIGNFSLTLCTGITYHAFDWLSLRAYPSIRSNFGYYFPGVSVDIAYLFSSKKLVEL